MNNLKYYFLIVVVIAAFIMAPNLAPNLMLTCKNVMAGIKGSSEQLREGLQNAPPLLPSQYDK